jgi:hypothetical protein
MVLAGTGLATPKLADGQIEALRLLKIARDTAVKAKTTAMITLKATLVTASDDLRGELEPLSDFKLITACAALKAGERIGDPDSAMRHVLRALARRWLELHDEIKIHTRELKQITTAATCVTKQRADQLRRRPDFCSCTRSDWGSRSSRASASRSTRRLRPCRRPWPDRRARSPRR